MLPSAQSTPAEAAERDGRDAKSVLGRTLPETAISRLVDVPVRWAGELAGWLWTALMLLIVVQVVQRYVFSVGSIKIEELQWHIYAIGFMLGLAATETAERHVRIDVIAERWTWRARLRIEIAGIVFLLMPFCALVLWYAAPYVAASWQLNERSAAPDGLLHRWFVKSFILAAFGLLSIAGVSRLSRCWAALRAAR